MKIAGIGDNVIDRYLNYGVIFPGGNAVNVAAHAAKLGAEAAYIGSIGADREGSIIKKALESLGVDLSQCIFEPGTTTKRCDVNVYHGEREYLGMDTGKNWAHILSIRPQDVEYLKDFHVIHTSCNAKIHKELYKLKDLKAMVTFDFSEKEKYRTRGFLSSVCPFLELGQFSCDGTEEKEIKRLLCLAHDLGCRNVIATMGGKGQIFFNGDEFTAGRACYVEALDTMGAGDSFLAALLVSLLGNGWKKGRRIPGDVVKKGLREASEYSAANCMSEGGFGFKNTLS